MTTYYPLINGVSVSASPAAVPGNGYSVISINAPVSNATSKTITVNTSLPASFNNSTTVLSSTQSFASYQNPVTVKLYNKNATTDTCVSYIGVTVTARNNTYYTTKSLTQKIYLDGAPKVNNSYFNYYNTYYTYTSNGHTTVTYYKIDSFYITPSASSAVPYGASVKITPRLSVNSQNAYTDVASVQYTVKTPYGLTLASGRNLYSGSTTNLGAITLYNNSASASAVSCSVSAMVRLKNGMTKTALTSIVVSPKPADNTTYYNSYYNTPALSVTSSGPSALSHNATAQYNAVINVTHDTVKSIAWKSSNSAVLAIDGANNSTVVKVSAHNDAETNKTVTLTVTVTSQTGLVKSYVRAVTVSGKPVVEDEKPSVAEISEKIAYIFDNAKAQAMAELAKLV